MPGDLSPTLQPPLCTTANTVDYNQRLTVSSGEVVNTKFANFYLLTLYIIYHLTPLT
jgi:dihydroorotase